MVKGWVVLERIGRGLSWVEERWGERLGIKGLIKCWG